MPDKTKLLICLIILFSALLGCINKTHQYKYIKIQTITEADSVTDLNKGVKTENFLYYNPVENRVVFRFAQPSDSKKFNTYTGYLPKKGYVDTISALVTLLKHHKNGFVANFLDTTGTYCGPTFHAEYADESGTHFIDFIIDDNDTLDRFCNLFYELENLPWKKQKVDNRFVDETGEVIKLLKGDGSYDKMIKPYVPLPCKPGIEMDKLYGKWRSEGQTYLIDTDDDHAVYKFDTTGILIYEIKKDTIVKETPVKIKSIKGNIIETESNKRLYKLEVVNLTENCLEFKINNRSLTSLYRLK
jgi:hypothetical protein